LDHKYAPKDAFKGNHDGQDKTVKNSMEDTEKNEICLPDALSAYDHVVKARPGRPSKDWPALEGKQHPKLLSRTPFSPTNIQFTYCTNNQAEYERLCQEYPTERIMYCNRELIPKSCRTISGSQDFGKVRGTRVDPVIVVETLVDYFDLAFHSSSDHSIPVTIRGSDANAATALLQLAQSHLNSHNLDCS
jgi:hypothetical protein